MALSGIITTWLKPIIIMVFIVGFIAWIFYIFYWFIKRSGGNISLWIRYKLLRRQPDEKVVAWCLEANKQDYTVGKVKQKLLTHGHDPVVAEEICYIYAMIRKMKGGLMKDEQRVRESHLKTLPEIEGEGGGGEEVSGEKGGVGKG